MRVYSRHWQVANVANHFDYRHLLSVSLPFQQIGYTRRFRYVQFLASRRRSDEDGVKHSNYHRTVLDGGRTNAICFHAEIAAAGGWPTYVGDFYAEFYYTFTGSFM